MKPLLLVYCYSPVYIMATMSLWKIWSPKSSHPIFAATTALRRFKSILRFLRSDNKVTRSERRTSDKLAAIRNVLESFVSQLRKFHIPGADIGITVMNSLYHLEENVLFDNTCTANLLNML